MQQSEREAIHISCDECEWQGTHRCEDCVVSFIVDREQEGSLVVDADEARAIRRLGDAGLVPLLQLRRREAG